MFSGLISCIGVKRYIYIQERIRMGNLTWIRACNYVKFETGQNFPPVLYKNSSMHFTHCAEISRLLLELHAVTHSFVLSMYLMQNKQFNWKTNLEAFIAVLIQSLEFWTFTKLNVLVLFVQDTLLWSWALFPPILVDTTSPRASSSETKLNKNNTVGPVLIARI